MSSTGIRLRPGTAGDTLTISALAIQVFLDTYAADGIRPDLAEEAFGVYSAEVFAERLAEPDRKFVLAEAGTGLIGFAEVRVTALPAPAGDCVGAELIRLYVQPAAQGRGLGRALLRAAEHLAADASAGALWLTAWEENRRALAFYARMGYADIGATTYTFQDRSYGNRVFAKRLARA